MRHVAALLGRKFLGLIAVGYSRNSLSAFVSHNGRGTAGIKRFDDYGVGLTEFLALSQSSWFG